MVTMVPGQGGQFQYVLPLSYGLTETVRKQMWVGLSYQICDNLLGSTRKLKHLGVLVV